MKEYQEVKIIGIDNGYGNAGYPCCIKNGLLLSIYYMYRLY